MNAEGCLRCPRGVCPKMGYEADRSDARGKFFLKTRGSAPYCGKRRIPVDKLVDGTLDMTSDAPTNAEKHVTSK